MIITAFSCCSSSSLLLLLLLLLLQVELNTIASSFGCLSSLTAALHKYIASRLQAYEGVQHLVSGPDNE